MEDITLTCTDCSEEFIFTGGEREFYEEKGYNEPKRCKSCRTKRKAEKGNRGFNSY